MLVALALQHAQELRGEIAILRLVADERLHGVLRQVLRQQRLGVRGRP
jgi:hypothetical protein